MRANPVIQIRPACPEDGPGIGAVRVRTWQTAYRDLIPQEYLDQLDPVKDGERWKSGLEDLPAERCAFVLEEAGEKRITGFVVAGPNRDPDPEYDSELYAIYVLPECQGQGLGRGLFEAAAGWLASRGSRRMVLFVLRENWPSRRFYERMGGKVVRSRTIEIGGATLAEVGYGYDLAHLP